MYCNFSIADADCGCECGCGMRMRIEYEPALTLPNDSLSKFMHCQILHYADSFFELSIHTDYNGRMRKSNKYLITHILSTMNFSLHCVSFRDE